VVVYASPDFPGDLCTYKYALMFYVVYPTVRVIANEMQAA
jgi:hypothetical protein